MKLLFATVLLSFSSVSLASEPAHFHYEGVLGTSMDISIQGLSAKQAEPEIEKLLQDIAKLEKNLSSWQQQSEISKLNQSKKIQDPSVELVKVLELCQSWAKRSMQHFSCKMGEVQRKWQQAFQQKQAPDRVELRHMAKDLQQASYSVNQQKIELDPKVTLDIAGVAKGYILDQSLNRLKHYLPDAMGIQLNIGGDLVFWQHQQASDDWQIHIADPFATHDNQSLMQLSLKNGAIAASGHKSRGYQIENRFFSHIFAPDDGWPLDEAPAAIVYAKDSASADAIATALAAQPATAGIDWVNELADVEALIIAPSGIKLASDGWQKLLTLEKGQTPITAPLLEISYQIPKLEAEKYHKPYLSIWITDDKNKSIRNLLLLGDSERWAKKNNRWWRRVGRRNPDLLNTLARPTRRPGQYQLSWDGLDDFGHPVAKQKYWLHFEASREAGGHNYQKVSIDLTQDQIQQALEAKGELGTTTISSLPNLAHFNTQ